MTTVQIPTNTTGTESAATTTRRLGLGRATVIAAVGAAAANLAVAAIARPALGIDLAIQGEEIPLAGFPQLTAFFVLVGAGLAWLIGRRAADPRRAFLRLTAALTVVSCVPSVLIDASVATRSTLVVTHLVAAAIAVPVLASALRPRA